MNIKKYAAVLCVLMMSAGCAAPAGSSNAQPETVSALLKSAEQDDTGLKAWSDIFAKTSDSYSGTFSLAGSGEAYLWKDTKDQEMVKEDFIYDIGRIGEIAKMDDSTCAVDLTDVDDSYHDLITGTGLINRYGKDALNTAVKLSSTKDNAIKGSVMAVSTDTGLDAKTGTDETMIDLLVNYGYVRTVDPFHNASLYNYEAAEKDGKWVVTATIKDLDSFKQHATVKAVLAGNPNELPVLLMDQVEKETYTFTFDENGALTSSQDQIYHVINGLTPQYQETFMNLNNKIEITKNADGALSKDAFGKYFEAVTKGELKAGDAFEIAGWK